MDKNLKIQNNSLGDNLNSNIAKIKNGIQSDIQKGHQSKSSTLELTSFTSEGSSKSSNKNRNKENNDIDSLNKNNSEELENRTKSGNECASTQPVGKNKKVNKKRNSKKVSKSSNK